MKSIRTICTAAVLVAAALVSIREGQEATLASSTPDPAQVGQTVSVAGNADVTLIGIDIERGTQPPDVMERPRPGYEFIEASFSFHNPQSAGIDLPLHAFLGKSRGKTIHAPMVFLPNPKGSYGNGYLAPEETGQGYVIYEVRAYDKHALLIYRPDPVHPHHQAAFQVQG